MEQSFFASESFESLIQGCALVFTIGFFIAGSATCLKIHQQKSVKNVNFLPYLTTCLNGFLWLVYGILNRDLLLVAVNGTGCCFQIAYIFVFMQNCDNKHHYLKKVMLMVVTCVSVVFFAQLPTTIVDAVSMLGWVASSVTIIMFASPLSTIREVLRSQNPETISFPLSVMTCLVAGSWFIYGYLKHDAFIQVPNILGFLLGVIQVSVILLLSKHKETSKLIV